MAISIQQGMSGTPVPAEEHAHPPANRPQRPAHPRADTQTMQADEQGSAAAADGAGLPVLAEQLPAPVARHHAPDGVRHQHGPGFSATLQRIYDLLGNVTWSMDECGYITYRQHDALTGAVTQSIRDVDGSQLTLPSGWSTPGGGGLHLVSDFQVDALGRVTQALGPEHVAIVSADGTQSANVRTATWSVYDEAAHEVHTVRAISTSPTAATPWSTRYRSASRTRPAGNRGHPGGAEARPPGRSPPPTASRSPATAAGRSTAYAQNRLQWTRVYHAIPAEGEGLPGVELRRDRLRLRLRRPAEPCAVARRHDLPRTSSTISITWRRSTWAPTTRAPATPIPTGGGARATTWRW